MTGRKRTWPPEWHTEWFEKIPDRPAPSRQVEKRKRENHARRKGPKKKKALSRIKKGPCYQRGAIKTHRRGEWERPGNPNLGLTLF